MLDERDILKKGWDFMWTVLWVDNGRDRWDRFETKEEVEELIKK